MNNEAKGNCSIKLDRLSICYNDSNQEYVQKTCGLLRDHNMPESIPGMTITKNPRYHVSCVIPVPFKEASSKTMACFEAGPRRPGQASYRLDYNPSKLSEAGFDDLSVFLETIIDPDVVGFFRASKVTRCDIALDLLGLHHEDFIVLGMGLGKHLGAVPVVPFAKAA